VNLLDMSEGGAYVHNLMTVRIVSRTEPRRSTPYHKAHTTALLGIDSIVGGDDRFYNNLLVGNGGPPASGSDVDANPLRFGGYGLWVYNFRAFPLQTGGNVYTRGARPYVNEAGALNLAAADPKPEIVEEEDCVYLRINLGPEVRKAATQVVTTELLGKAKIPGLGYENADGSPITIDTDYFGKKRSRTAPFAGPFENPGQGELKLKVW